MTVDCREELRSENDLYFQTMIIPLYRDGRMTVDCREELRSENDLYFQTMIIPLYRGFRSFFLYGNNLLILLLLHRAFNSL